MAQKWNKRPRQAAPSAAPSRENAATATATAEAPRGDRAGNGGPGKREAIHPQWSFAGKVVSVQGNTLTLEGRVTLSEHTDLPNGEPKAGDFVFARGPAKKMTGEDGTKRLVRFANLVRVVSNGDGAAEQAE